MPTQTVWIEPELLLEHHGVRVFHTYKEDDYDQGAKRYWFTVNSPRSMAARIEAQMLSCSRSQYRSHAA